MVDNESGDDISSSEEYDQTALFCAVKENNRNMVEKLINRGADINVTNIHGETPLFYAVQIENEKVVSTLIDRGADVNATNEDGNTALFFVVNEKVLKKLIDCGADVNATNIQGETPLFFALNEKVVSTLIDCDVDVKATNIQGDTSLFYAVERENGKVVSTLMDCGASVNATNKQGETPLFYALNEKVVSTLIECGVDVNITNIHGETPLFYAVERENENVASTLIECGANINATNKHGDTPLFYAVERENENVASTLIDCGANVNATNKQCETPLFYAVERENEKVVEKLIECGADVNATNEYGNTALFFAVHRKNDKVAKTLIGCGADINATNIYGETPLFSVVRRESEKVVSTLIDCGVDVNATNIHGATPLFYAVKRENEKVVEKLIDRGADVNATDKQGVTPLFYAVKRENEKMVQKLIECGVSINATDKNGNTALAYAMTQSLSLSKYLLDKGARLHLNENCNVLTFFIEKCLFSLPERNTHLRDGLNLLIERKDVNEKNILEAIASVAFCKTLCFKPGSCDIDVDTLSELMKLAKNYTSTYKVLLPAGKHKNIYAISRMIHKECHGTSLVESTALELLQLLFKFGANPNTTDSDGNTALHHATQLAFHGVTQQSVMKICQQLQTLNVSYMVTNHQNETPLLYCLTTTIEKASKEEEPWPAVKTQADVCRFLVKHGSSVEVKTKSGETVLHLVIRLLQQGFSKRNSDSKKVILDAALELLEVVLAFKKQDVSTNMQDDSGNTPLHLWANLQLAPGQDYSSNITKEHTFNKLAKLVLALLSQDKELLDVKNENGETPLHLCSTWTAAELLLSAGANPNCVDSSGRSPLHLAARNNEFVREKEHLYPDNFLAPETFWRTVLKKGFNPWTVDIHNGSLLSVLMESESHELARALVDVACDDEKVRSHPLTLFSLLNAICRDKIPDAQWKKDAAEKILSSTKCPVNGNANVDSPLHYCCRNVVESSRSLSSYEIKNTVYWRLAKLLRSFGADFRIPDATNQSCIDIAKECPALKDLLMEPIDLDRFPVLIKPWKSVSKTHERSLTGVARHLESECVESYWYHKDCLARGSFGAVFAGINEKDGREVAIKRIEKIRMHRPEDKREITSLTVLADCEQVVRYLCFFEDKHFSYIVLELMEENLEQFLNTAIQTDTKVLLCQDVVKGVIFLHDHHIIHRDLKPSNILYRTHPKLCLKIADFGLSRRDDSTGSSISVYGPNVGTRCWIAPEVLKATKAPSKSSDVFACGLVLHYILSVKKHPFAPRTGALQLEIEANILKGKMEGWDDSLCPEAAHLIKAMLDGDQSKRLSADKALDHPFFWSKKKKVDVLIAVGNEREFGCPRAKRTPPLIAVETDLENSFGTIVKYVDWNDLGYVHMPAIYSKMKKKRKYKTNSVVELVRLIRNANVHVNELPKPIQKLVQEDFVFLEYFPNLVMEVYKAVTTHGWDQTRHEIKEKLNK